MTLVPTREYTDAATMLANYARIRKQLYAPAPEAPTPLPSRAAAEPVPLARKGDADRVSVYWSKADDAKLFALARQGRSAKQVAFELGRSPMAIKGRCRRLGVAFGKIPRDVDAIRFYCLSYERQSERLAGGQLANIIRETAARHGLSESDLLAETRNKSVVAARREAMWLCARDTAFSYVVIGQRFKRDHSTVVHAVQRENARLGTTVRGSVKR